MIEIAALTKRFPGAPHPAIDHLTLTVAEGEVCVLIGPSGCGKTTTMRIDQPDDRARRGHGDGRTGAT